MLCCTILYYTNTIYYGILILYYAHNIILFSRCCGDRTCLTLKLPERGILQRSSVGWVLQTPMMTYQKQLSLLCIGIVFSWVWIKQCSEYFEKKRTHDVLTSDTKLVYFCAFLSHMYSWTEFVIKFWPWNKLLFHRERPKWTSSPKHPSNPTVECTWRKAWLHTLNWTISVYMALVCGNNWANITLTNVIGWMSCPSHQYYEDHSVCFCVYQV